MNNDKKTNALHGIYISSGKAHFKHRKTNEMSFFVQTRNPKTKKITELWGKDLERVMQEIAPKKGDKIALKVDETAELKDGKKRNTWSGRNLTKEAQLKQLLADQIKTIVVNERGKITQEDLKRLDKRLGISDAEMKRAAIAEFNLKNNNRIAQLQLMAADEFKQPQPSRLFSRAPGIFGLIFRVEHEKEKSDKAIEKWEQQRDQHNKQVEDARAELKDLLTNRERADGLLAFLPEAREAAEQNIAAAEKIASEKRERLIAELYGQPDNHQQTNNQTEAEIVKNPSNAINKSHKPGV